MPFPSAARVTRRHKATDGGSFSGFAERGGIADRAEARARTQNGVEYWRHHDVGRLGQVHRLGHTALADHGDRLDVVAAEPARRALDGLHGLLRGDVTG